MNSFKILEFIYKIKKIVFIVQIIFIHIFNLYHYIKEYVVKEYINIIYKIIQK